MKNGMCFLFLLLLHACNQAGENNTALTQPPYNQLTDSLQQQPKNAGLYYRRGALLYQNEQLQLAKADLQKAWQLEPTEEHALSLVTVLIKSNPDSAIQFIQHALEELPRSVALQLGLARGYQQQGNAQKALQVCDQVLVLYPTSLDALLLKAEILKQQNNNTAALATLEKAYSYAPFDAELGYNLAFEYAETKNEKAIALTDSLMKSDSTGKAAQPYYLRGVYYANTGNTPEALNYFNQAIAHDYTFFDAYMDKGTLLFDAKHYKEALQVFQLVNRISPTYAEAYYWTGKCEEALGQKAEAKLDYQRAFGLDTALHEAKAAAARL
jgi:tetratricopeptide (TPR) repeat protein